MCDSDNADFIVDTSMTRRSVVVGLSAVAAATGLPAAARAAKIVETDVMVTTPDGQADAALFHPSGRGAWPAILLWPDILGLRPVFREMGRRLAAQGYTAQPILSHPARADRQRAVRIRRQGGDGQIDGA